MYSLKMHRTVFSIVQGEMDICKGFIQNLMIHLEEKYEYL